MPGRRRCDPRGRRAPSEVGWARPEPPLYPSRRAVAGTLQARSGLTGPRSPSTLRNQLSDNALSVSELRGGQCHGRYPDGHLPCKWPVRSAFTGQAAAHPHRTRGDLMRKALRTAVGASAPALAVLACNTLDRSPAAPSFTVVVPPEVCTDNTAMNYGGAAPMRIPHAVPGRLVHLQPPTVRRPVHQVRPVPRAQR